MAICKRCGRVTEDNEIHLFQGREERRLAVEEAFKTKVTLCTNPPSESFWSNDKKEWYERDDIDSGKPLTMDEANRLFEKWLVENMERNNQ